MSLINEALKKAQGERPVQGNSPPPGGDAPEPPQEPGHYVPPPDKGRKSFIWGFVFAVLIVGTVTILLSTYFVWKILGPQEGEKTPETAEVQEVPEATPPPAETVDPVVSVQAPPPAEEPAPVQSLPEKPVAGPVEVIEPVHPAAPPDPAVIARLMELEIRGIMGGTRVLIFDQSSGRNKSFREGDSLEGPMGLVVENISNSSIKFKDYAGQIHTKSF